MTDLSTLARDPEWLPHRIDPAAGTLQFLHIPRGDLSGPQFLAERTPATPADEAFLPLDALDALGAEQPDPGPLHFIFHTAFCRSTLLVRALDIPGTAAGLSEPGILVSLTNMGDAGRPLVKPMLDLLARRHGSGDGEGEAAVVVKPTNHANRLIPALLDACPDAKAVLMTNPLPAFLAAVVRKGMMGRRWGRQLYLETMGYAGMDLGMDAREQFAMTDLQAAGLAWFLNQRYFAMLLDRYPGRLRTLDGDAFNARRAETLTAVAELFDLPLDTGRAAEIAKGRVFASHSKRGGDFNATAAKDNERAHSPLVEEEIKQVGQWIDIVAQQAGLQLPATTRTPLL
ncbi:MAG: hypothetical protein KKE69_12295 [Alphaproteobacteria bacterium]|jgi:hypothetical protein|nr:hypothetical protein [Alphaproteobacteria bacterium]